MIWIVIVIVIIVVIAYSESKGRKDIKNVEKHGGIDQKYNVLINLLMQKKEFRKKLINSNNLQIGYRFIGDGYLFFKLIEIDKKLIVKYESKDMVDGIIRHNWSFDEYKNQNDMFEDISERLFVANLVSKGVSLTDAGNEYFRLKNKEFENNHLSKATISSDKTEYNNYEPIGSGQVSIPMECLSKEEQNQVKKYQLKEKLELEKETALEKKRGGRHQVQSDGDTSEDVKNRLVKYIKKKKLELGENFNFENFVIDTIEQKGYDWTDKVFNNLVKGFRLAGEDYSNSEQIYQEYFVKKNFSPFTENLGEEIIEEVNSEIYEEHLKNLKRLAKLGSKEAVAELDRLGVNQTVVSTNTDGELRKELKHCLSVTFDDHNLDKGEVLSKELIARDVKDITPYMCLSAIYGTRENWHLCQSYSWKGLEYDDENILLLNHLGVSLCQLGSSKGLEFLKKGAKLGDQTCADNYNYWSSRI